VDLSQCVLSPSDAVEVRAGGDAESRRLSVSRRTVRLGGRRL
jgi:hypothetical protein